VLTLGWIVLFGFFDIYTFNTGILVFDPFYLWVVMFLVALSIIPCFIIFRMEFEFLGEEPYQEKKYKLLMFSVMFSGIPAMMAILNIVLTGNLLFSLALFIYGVLYALITSRIVLKGKI
jgi:hypothetical protein